MRKFHLGLVAAGVILICSAVAAQERFTPRMTDERAREILRAMDRDGDGVVSRAEFTDAMSQGEVSSAAAKGSSTRVLSTGLWDALDSNRDGVLDVGEIKARLPLPYVIH